MVLEIWLRTFFLLLWKEYFLFYSIHFTIFPSIVERADSVNEWKEDKPGSFIFGSKIDGKEEKRFNFFKFEFFFSLFLNHFANSMLN